MLLSVQAVIETHGLSLPPLLGELVTSRLCADVVIVLSVQAVIETRGLALPRRPRILIF